MNKPQDHQLDHLLQDWAQRHAVGADDLASLERRIKDHLATEHRLTSATQPQSVAARASRRVSAALVGLAAALLIALFGWWYLKPRDSSVDVAQAPSPPRDQAHLLAEYQEVFGPELCWLVEQPSRSEIGLRPPKSQPSAVPNDFVAVRLLLVARPASGQEWKEIQALDVVARREEVVEVVAESDRQTALTLWAYPLDDKMVSIDLRYKPSEFAGQATIPAGVAIESSSVQSLGESAPVYSFERDGVEYRLYQSAVLVSGNGVG
jgi:hypothetical protein